MSGSRPIFVAKTPIIECSEVVCTREAWEEHVIGPRIDGTPAHPELVGKEFAVKWVIENPSLVLQERPRPYLVFTNTAVKNERGYPLCAIADPKKQSLVTAYYARRLHADKVAINADDIIWSKQDDS